jgi:predicted ATPase/DNA-binding SARP family transcriptional activator
VWGGPPWPRDPKATLRTYVTRLRTVLGSDQPGSDAPALRGGGMGYTLDLGDHLVDAEVFAASLQEASALAAEQPSRALGALEEALGLWRGPALMEVADEPWAAPEIARLEELRLAANELRLACLVELGHVRVAIGELERHVREHPFREEPRRQLMLAHALVGRSAEAAEVFRGFRDELAEGTGLDPSDSLQQLHARLLGRRESHSGGTGAPRTNLTMPRTSFVGRRDDLPALIERVRSSRLVTLTGAGGAGKTRLATEAAWRLMDRFPDGVHLVELASLVDAELVVRAVADGVAPPAGHRSASLAAGDREDRLVAHLRSRRTLLVLDNAEHLIDAVAALVERLLDGCPRLTALVTSREPVGIDGECLWPVGPLATSSSDGSEPDAMRLLVDRTRQLRPSFEVTDLNRADLEAIGRGLDGLPLALELAAGRLAHLGPGDVRARLGDQLRLLTGGPRRVRRQRTLQATIDWSYRLLDTDEQALLRDLSAFAGYAPLEAVVGIARVPGDGRDAIEVLGSLVAKSLVTVEEVGADSRHRLLESVRLYAEEAARAAGEWDRLRDRHRDWFLDWLERFDWDHRVASPRVARQAEAWHADLRRALEHSRDGGRTDLLARQLMAMSGLFAVQGRLGEGRRWHAVAATESLGDPVEQARLDAHRCYLDVWIVLGEREPYVRMLRELEAVIEQLPHDAPEIALARFTMAGCVTFLTQDAAAILAHAQAGTDQALAVGAPQFAAGSAGLAAGAHLFAGDAAAAIATLEAVVGRPEWQDAHDGLRVRASLATVRYLAGDPAGAAQDARTALSQLGSAWHQDALGTLALASAAQGDLPAGRRILASLLDEVAAEDWGNWARCSDVAIVAGALAVHEGDLERACRLLAPVRWSTTPHTYAIFLDCRRRLGESMDAEHRHAIVAEARGRELAEALREERDRLQPAV